MASQHTHVYTEGSSQFDPDGLFNAWESSQKTLPEDNDLRSSIISTFHLTPSDDYVYHATASVTLAQVQGAIKHGGGSGLHAWYLDGEGKPVRHHLVELYLPQWLDDLMIRAFFPHLSYRHHPNPMS